MSVRVTTHNPRFSVRMAWRTRFDNRIDVAIDHSAAIHRLDQGLSRRRQ